MTFIRSCGAALVACLVALAAVPAVAAPTPLDLPRPPADEEVPRPHAPAPTRLTEQLEELQAYPQTRPRGTVGLAVHDAWGTTVAGRRPGRRLLPASTTKLVTAAAALRMLGPDHRFVTRAYVTRGPDGDGVVDGDLVILGGGDPALAAPRYRRRVNSTRPATPLRRLAARVADSGVTRIRGRVRADPSVLSDQPMAAGWLPDYLTTRDATRSSGLTVDAGLRLFRRSGSLRGVAARDPARRAARQLDRLLRSEGVRIGGGAARGPLPAGAIEVARIASPRLHVLIDHMLRFSDNHLADGVFRMLGAAAGDPTWDGSEAASRAALGDVDVDWTRLRLADGSGLSRDDRLTADALVGVLRVMAQGPLRRRWLALLPVAGRTGTIASRLAGTQAAGRVHAKSGTLRDVRALAGTVPGGGRREDLHFAVLVNDTTTAQAVASARRLADVIGLALVVAQDGCAGPVPVPEGSARRAPEQRLCGAARRDRRPGAT